MAVTGFELVQERFIAELRTTARLYRHVKTGAQLLSMENSDENKVFSVNFYTPVSDSTGLPHIMEHSVLCGSRRYPVKEPFVELLKGSVYTFVNAFTFPDKTCYPVATQNMQDFYNLIDVYLDAVFYPRITPETLMQEGWHYEAMNAAEPITFKGVVFNEMKGAYSSPDEMLSTYSAQSLFPDNYYRFDAGGDPKVIPDLTYSQFKAYHDTYYHPSNALIYFYGDDDPARRLALIDTWLNEFQPIHIERQWPTQARFSAPKRFVFPYDAGEDDGEAKKAQVVVNWLLTESTDLESRVGLSILTHILTGTPASPLYKALIDSGLGEGLANGRIEDQIRLMYYGVGLKGIAPEDNEQVEALILETLQKLAVEGIDPDTVAASMNTVEFDLREQNTGGFPRGLYQMLTALSAWLYGGDPMDALAFEAPLEAVKTRLAAGEKFFEGLIRRYLLDNPHRTTVSLVPDFELRAREDAAERSRLDAARARMTETDIERLVAETEALRRAQETPDSPEALATIPALQIADLDKNVRTIPVEQRGTPETPILFHDLFTNGIVYLDLGFDLHALAAEDLPFVSLFSRALLEMGTARQDFVQLSQRIGQQTGGIAPTTFLSMKRNESGSAAYLFLRGKSTVDQAEAMLDILRDVLLTVRLDDVERFRQIALDEKTELESGLSPSGHMFALNRVAGHLNEAGWAEEQMSGVSQLFFVRNLLKQIESDWPSVRARLESMRQTLVNRRAMICNVTIDAERYAKVEPRLNAFLGDLPMAAVSPAPWRAAFAPASEGLSMPSQVNYVAKGANLYDLGYKLHGSSQPITRFLRTTYLWERVRVQGGAYGGFIVFDRFSGACIYCSYRDPNLLGTIQNYDGVGKFLRELELPEKELVRTIVGAVGQMDAYQLPDAKGYTSLIRHLIGETDALRQQFRDEMLSTTLADFRRFGEALDGIVNTGIVAVLGSPNGLESAAEPLKLKITKVM